MTRPSGYGCSAAWISSLDDVRAVVLRGVDVVDAELDRPAQHRDRGVAVPRRAEDARAREAASRRSRCGRPAGRASGRAAGSTMRPTVSVPNGTAAPITLREPECPFHLSDAIGAGRVVRVHPPGSRDVPD